MRKKWPVAVLWSAMCALVLGCAGAGLRAQTDAQFLPATKVFRLDGGNVTYAFGVNARGELQQLYWGGRLAATDAIPQATPMPGWASFDPSYSTTPQEYAGWGAGLYVEPALKATFADGNRDLVLHYASHTAVENGFDVVLKDFSRPIVVTLHYRMDPASGVLARWATIENRGKEEVTLEQAAAAAWALPPDHYTLNYLTGRWAGEWALNQERLKPGERVLESRRGSTGHQANPWFAIQ
ncbi:MAG TPA: glycoside hydrolase family 36 N-terminal domain-containing protein, partial [Terracidiphilus sp.]|nr:glycoside hydrolase family 36 N-terminal domain-containing protein [Terracidiphilus sp.]